MEDVVRRRPEVSMEKLDAREGDKADPMTASSITLYMSTTSQQAVVLVCCGLQQDEISIA